MKFPILTDTNIPVLQRFISVKLHFVECGMGWSKWWYGVRVILLGREVMRIKLAEDENHWRRKKK